MRMNYAGNLPILLSDKMDNQRYYDTHLLDNLVGTYIILHTGKYVTDRIMVKLIDFDYGYLLLETPKAHKQFLLYKGRISEIEPLTQQEAEARLKKEVVQK